MDSEAQKRAARQGKAFEFWRRRLEENDILVFVISGPHWSVDLKEMRGFSIANRELPVLVVNGKDYSQGGKVFTLIHELCHVLLGESAISNGAAEDPQLAPVSRTVERFCDAVAAATLMPRDMLLAFDEVAGTDVREWSDAELQRVGSTIGVSRQALLLRFVTLKRATWDYYRERHEAFEEEYRRRAEERAREKKAIAIKRPVMLMILCVVVLRGSCCAATTVNALPSTRFRAIWEPKSNTSPRLSMPPFRRRNSRGE